MNPIPTSVSTSTSALLPATEALTLYAPLAFATAKTLDIILPKPLPKPRLAAAPLKPKAKGPIHRIVHGDCLEKMAKIPDRSIDFICSDLPYNISGKGGLTMR